MCWVAIDRAMKLAQRRSFPAPLVRWQRDIEQIRQLPPATDLRRLFFHRVDRLVRKDSTFLLKNRFFEAPSHLAGKRIEVRFDPLDLTQLEIYSEGKPEGRARLVDAVVNRSELAMPPAITVEMAKGFSLYMVKAVMSCVRPGPQVTMATPTLPVVRA